MTDTESEICSACIFYKSRMNFKMAEMKLRTLKKNFKHCLICFEIGEQTQSNMITDQATNFTSIVRPLETYLQRVIFVSFLHQIEYSKLLPGKVWHKPTEKPNLDKNWRITAK